MKGKSIMKRILLTLIASTFVLPLIGQFPVHESTHMGQFLVGTTATTKNQDFRPSAPPAEMEDDVSNKLNMHASIPIEPTDKNPTTDNAPSAPSVSMSNDIAIKLAARRLRMLNDQEHIQLNAPRIIQHNAPSQRTCIEILRQWVRDRF